MLVSVVWTLNLLCLLPLVSAKLSLRQHTWYIRTPHGAYLGELRRTKWDTHSPGMPRYKLDVPLRQPIWVYGYQTDVDEHISRKIAVSGSWETELVYWMCRTMEMAAWSGIQPNYLDVGANIGALALPVATCVQGKGQVFAVEGMPDIATRLKAGVVENSLGNVAVYSYVVGAPEARNSVKIAEHPTNKGASAVSGSKDWSRHAWGPEVQLTTLDAMLAENPHFQFLLLAKLDIEGSEGLALQGARDLLSHYPPCYLVAELVEKWLRNAKTPSAVVIDQLRTYGYDVSELPSPLQGTYVLKQADMKGCLARLRNAQGRVNSTAFLS